MSMNTDVRRRVTLGELCSEGGGGIQTGPFGSQLHAADYVSVGIPSVMPQNIGDNTIDEGGIARITDADAARLQRYRLAEGDIVYSRRGDVEKRALVRAEHEGWLCGTGCLRVRLGDPRVNDARFVSYLLGVPATREWISQHAVGATMPNLNTGILSSVPLEVPSIIEQLAIADVLGALDDKIAANTRLAASSAELANLLFRSAVHERAIAAPLAELVVLLSRGIAPSYTEDVDGSVLILNQKCVRGQRVDLGPARRTKPERVRALKVLVCEDVLINSTGQGTLGRVARWTGQDEATVDSHVTIARFDPAKVDPTCAGFAMIAMQPEIEAMGEGSTGQTELSRVELGKLPVRVPPLETSRALGEELRAMSAMESAVLSESDSLAAIRDALLPQLMSGKLRVKDAEKVLEGVL